MSKEVISCQEQAWEQELETKKLFVWKLAKNQAVLCEGEVCSTREGVDLHQRLDNPREVEDGVDRLRTNTVEVQPP